LKRTNITNAFRSLLSSRIICTNNNTYSLSNTIFISQQILFMRDFRRPPRSSLEMRSSGFLRE